MVVFRSDPCGICCIIITYGAVLYADYVVVRHLIIPAMSDSLWGMFNVLVFNLIVFFLSVAHMRARNGWSVCMKCENYRPPRAHHCRICRRVHSICLIIESLLFGLFVIAIGCDQMSAIFSDETGVEYVKKEGLHRNKPKMFLLKEVFGNVLKDVCCTYDYIVV
ncbi:ZDHC3-like protein [Mya arenaria]|uniref:ZDHC3-like protein n=1 Tax=Mya arenaria TaxID=6604 RepID=A0ABY7E9Q0_MYAAR|nr:ZDHC3-like protein [Mya arenaria]